MSRRSVLAILSALLVLVIVALLTSGPDAESETAATTTTSTTSTTTSSTTTTSTTTTTTTTTLPPDVVAVDALLAAMTDADIAQQLVVLGASGPDPVVGISDALGDACIGGIFVTKNVGNWQPAESLEAATDAIATVSESVADCPAPPFITTDAEPGTRVLKVPVDPLPTPASLAARLDEAPEGSWLIDEADRFASELSAAGVHVNLGIVADVDAGAGFYMDREGRSFGADPLAVGRLSQGLAAGHCRAGVVPTLKHFPNQGSTVEDPHLEDSFSVNGFDAWLDFGAAPYLGAPAPMVMTGHIRYEDVDDGLPASLSREITTGWLRDTLQFDGIVITDDLHTMRGVAQFTPEERGVTAIAAGADLALYVATDDAEAAVDAIVERMAVDEAFAEQARASARRVIELKGRLGLVASIDPSWFSETLCSSALVE